MHCHLRRRATVHWFWALLSRRERESQSGVVLAAPACHPCTQQFIQRQWQRQILGARHYWHRQLEWAYLSTTSSSTSLKFWSYNVGCQRCFKPMFIHLRWLCCQYQWASVEAFQWHLEKPSPSRKKGQNWGAERGKIDVTLSNLSSSESP